MTTVGDRLFQFGGAPVGSELLGLHGRGKVRWLDPDNGSDGNSGKKPEQAWKTLQYSADQLGYYKANADMNGYHDILIRLPGVEEVTSTVRFDGGGVATDPGDSISVVSSLSGLRVFGDVLHAHTRMASASAAADNVTVLVVRRQINFYGLSFAGRGTGERGDGTGACLSYRVSNDATLDLGKHGSGGGNFHTVRGCNFRDDGGNDTVGIYEYGAGASEIIENTFGYNSAARGPVGIMIRGSATNNPFDIDIVGNLFRQCPKGIVMGAGTYQNLTVRDNDFQTCTIGVQGDSGAGGTGLFAGNRFDVAEGASAHDNNIGASGDTAANWNTDTAFVWTDTHYADNAT
jgi:hypothetical protein